jgi:pimeloyl-ACP methyl ester carboxylesterase
VRQSAAGGRGPTVLLLHGAGANHHYFAPLVERLGDSDLLIPSLPGRCGTEGDPLSTVTEAANWIEGLLVGFGMRDVIAVGHSLGGTIAMELAAMQSALPTTKPRLRGVITIATPRVPLDRRLTHLFAGRRQSDPCERAVAFLRDTSGPDWPSVAVREAAEAVALTPPEATISDLAALLYSAPGADFGAIDIPTTIIAGSLDPLAPPTQANRFAQQIAGSRLVLLRGVGHNPVLEATDKVADLVRMFVQDVRDRCGPAVGSGNRIG